jgi:hypothetical protein
LKTPISSPLGIASERTPLDKPHITSLLRQQITEFGPRCP